MKIYILLFLLLFSAIPASADLFEEMLNQQYITNISDLPENNNLKPDQTSNPDNSWMTDHRESDYVWGWFDLLCCKNMTRIGNNYYVQDPANSTIVMYETHVHIYNRYYFQRWIYDLQKYESAGQLCAELKATAVLYSIDESGFVSYAYPSRTFQKCVPVPLQYPALEQPIVNITEYVNPIQDKISIHVKDSNYSSIEISYNNLSAKHTLRIYHVEQTDKGINFANATKSDNWELSGKGIGRIKDDVIIDTNVSTINYSNLNITVYSPYGSLKVDNKTYNITRVEYKSEVVFNPVLIFFVESVSILTFSSFSILRRIL